MNDPRKPPSPHAIEEAERRLIARRHFAMQREVRKQTAPTGQGQTNDARKPSMDFRLLHGWRNNGWILTSEKLPPAKKPVLIGYYGNSSDDLVVRVGWYDGAGAWYLVGHANHDVARLTTFPGYWAEIRRIRKPVATGAIVSTYAQRLRNVIVSWKSLAVVLLILSMLDLQARVIVPLQILLVMTGAYGIVRVRQRSDDAMGISLVVGCIFAVIALHLSHPNARFGGNEGRSNYKDSGREVARNSGR